MRTDKIEAISLRLAGKSYTEISIKLGVAKSTLAMWFRNIHWSNDVARKNHLSSYSIEKLARMREKRLSKLTFKYEKDRLLAREIYIAHKNSPLFLSGLMLYQCLGDLNSINGNCKLSSASTHNILIFKRFLETFFAEFVEKAKLCLVLYKNSEVNDALVKWLCELDFPVDKVMKPIILDKISHSERLKYGTASIILTSKSLKIRLLELIRVYLEDMPRV